MVTITDVAARAGVSMKTVSRVLNNEAHVRSHLKEKVYAAIADLDYKPSLAARQLAGNRSFLISLLIHDTTNSYFSELVVAAATECRRHGYHLVSETFDEAENGIDVVARVTAKLRPDGIILPPPLCNDAAIIAAVERTRTPLVRLAGTGEHYGTGIEVHEREVAQAVVDHLVSLGHRRIGFIAPPFEHGAAQERRQGYLDALAAAGLAYDPALVRDGKFSFASGVAAGDALLDLDRRPTAIFAANDGMALGAMAAARRRRLEVPGDVAIAGFDDAPGSRMVFPQLTTVRQPLAAMARAAVAAILGHAMPDEAREHELLVRASTAGGDTLSLDRMDA